MTSVGERGGTGAEESWLSIVERGEVKPDVEEERGERIEERVGERVRRSEVRRKLGTVLL